MKTRLWFVPALLLAASFVVPLLEAQPSGPDAALLSRARAGEAAAQLELGRAYAQGKGVTQDGAQAVEWLKQAAAQNSIEACRALGELYRDGAGKNFPRDPAQAVLWYRKAAEAGDVDSQGMLGIFYSFGQGVAQDYGEAYFWLDLAASVEGPRQERYAANRQMIGQHVTADELEAIKERVAKWQAAHGK